MVSNWTEMSWLRGQLFNAHSFQVCKSEIFWIVHWQWYWRHGNLELYGGILKQPRGQLLWAWNREEKLIRGSERSGCRRRWLGLKVGSKACNDLKTNQRIIKSTRISTSNQWWKASTEDMWSLSLVPVNTYHIFTLLQASEGWLTDSHVKRGVIAKMLDNKTVQDWHEFIFSLNFHTISKNDS